MASLTFCPRCDRRRVEATDDFNLDQPDEYTHRCGSCNHAFTEQDLIDYLTQRVERAER